MPRRLHIRILDIDLGFTFSKNGASHLWCAVLFFQDALEILDILGSLDIIVNC